MIKTIYLIGNPNVGKSVIFSRLTGVRVIASNYPGTTVEFLKGYLKINNEKIEVWDLPGIYSLQPTSSAEEVTVSLLKQASKDQTLVINVIDSTNLERNLMLTLQLIEEGFSVIACLNMCDDAVHRGVSIDIRKLEEILGIPVVSTCAVTGMGIKLLIERLKDARPILKEKVSPEEHWKQIGRILEQVQKLEHRHHRFREILEDISVRPLPGFLISLGVIYVSFKIIRLMGDLLTNKIVDPIFNNIYQPLLEKLTVNLPKQGFLFHLVIGNLIDGKIDFEKSLGLLTTAIYVEFGIVLPYLFSFYLVLSILEDLGYLPRLAIILDNFLHRLGLHGYAIIPVLLGFGCNVPGILATRILESKRERFIASLLISIGVPCISLQAMILGVLGREGGIYVLSVYLVLFLLVLILGKILNMILPGYSRELLLEIPSYRFPPLSILVKKIFIRIKGFLIEALPIVMLGVFIVNISHYFNLFERVGRIFSPIVNGLFGLPKEAVVALVIGFLRKDVAVGMLVPLGLTVKQLFISVVLLSISFPCIATFVVLWKELGFKDLIKAIFIMVIISISLGGLLNLFIPG
ncbi:MAG: ferrous iron transporter B [Candidatus Omnitrophica bacterium]|nr:ferrous iron transporter B [Candidatus Omnitrophota bacterium]